MVDLGFREEETEEDDELSREIAAAIVEIGLW